MRTWQVQQAKQALSELIECALTQGPQCITRHGKPAVVVVDAEDWARRTRRGESPLTLTLKAPRLTDEEVDVLFSRRGEPPRKVRL